MRLDQLPRSDKVEDRRGSGPGGFPMGRAGGVGIGTIILLVIVGWALGINPDLFLPNREGRPIPIVDGGKPLVSLPGYRSETRFDNGVGLFLWGNLPEFIDIPLLDSAVILQPSTDADSRTRASPRRRSTAPALVRTTISASDISQARVDSAP